MEVHLTFLVSIDIICIISIVYFYGNIVRCHTVSALAAVVAVCEEWLLCRVTGTQ